MGLWAGIIAGLFMFAGGYWLISNVVTGTSAAEVVVQTVVPLALAMAVFIASVRFGG